MAVHVIENDKIKLTVEEHGAEIRSLIRKSDNTELMWQANSEFWGRTSPVLFPVVGNYFQKKSIFNGVTYELGQHGFARDMEFTLVNESADELLFELTDTPETLQKYPFKFILKLGYKIVDSTVKVSWIVENNNGEKMYFSIGGHPAFNCDLDTYTLRFEKSGKGIDSFVAKYLAKDNSGCLSDVEKSIPTEGGVLKMSDELFIDGALIVEEEQADAVTLVNPDGKDVITVTCPTPLFGVWSPDGKHAPFVCLEPWYGRADRVGFNQKLEEREYGNTLAAEETFNGGYEIIVK